MRGRVQVPGTYMRLNSETQLMEERTNRALRRKRLAQTRKSNPKLRALYRENLLHREVKASRLYSE